MPEAPHRFRVLGGLDLRRPDGSSVRSVLAQPKRIALLAYLTVEAGGDFVPRDRIMSVLWPDSDASRARQSLRNALYQIRRSVGAEILANRGAAEVGADTTLLSVDVLEFRHALSQGRFLEAADLYRGSFLPGFHLDENAEFEDWRSRLEAALRADALRAFRAGARAEEEAGNIEAARHLLGRAQDVAPRDEQVLRHRLRLLARQGNRAAAITEGEAWAEMLRSTLGIDPSEPTLELFRELRKGSSTPDVLAGPFESGALDARPQSRVSETGPGPTASRQADGRSPARRRWGKGRRATAGWIFGGTVLAATVLALVGRPTPLPSTDNGVVIQRFEADDGVGGAAAGYALGALAARSLDAMYGGVVLPPEGVSTVARDGPERPLIAGSVRAERDGLVAEITLASTLRPEHVLVRASADVDAYDLEALAARLVDQLGQRSDRVWMASVPVPPLTRAPGAVLPFFRGEVLAEGGRRAEARKAYETALALDSTFAMANVRLSMLLESMALREEAIVVSDRAVAASTTMTEAERQRLNAWRAYEWGNVEQALPMYEALVASGVPDPEIWLFLGEIRFHWGPQLGVPLQAADSAFRAVLSVSPDNVDALQHLVRLMGPVSSPEKIDELVGRLADLEVPEDVWMEARAISALSKRRPLDGEVAAWVVKGTFNYESRRLTQLAASARVPWDLASFIRSLPPTEEPRRRVLRRLLLAQLAAASGRMDEAREELAALALRDPARALEYRIFVELSSSVRPTRDDLEDLRVRLRALPESPRLGNPLMSAVADSGVYAPRAIVLDAMLTRQLGEPIDSATVMTRGRDRPEPFFPRYWRQVVTEIHGANGHHERILALMGPGGLEEHRIRPDPLSYLAGMSRWTRVRSLLAVGRDEEALRWLQTFPDVGGYDLVFVPHASLLSGRILERYGRRSEAAVAYRRAVELWEDADPEFNRLVAQAREGLERTASGS